MFVRMFAVSLALICAASLARAREESTPAPAAAHMPQARPGATDALAMFDGVWIGPARITGRDGRVVGFEQMERIGPMLNGEIRVMEGKARGEDGRVLFNAFTVFSATETGEIEMRSHIPGDQSARIIALRPDGYTWRTGAAGGAEMVYEITVRDGVWRETGVISFPDGRRFQSFEMILTRQSDTDWPAANPAFPTTD